MEHALFTSLPHDGFPSAVLQRALLRWVRKVESLTAKEAIKKYGFMTAGEWRIKIRSVENNQ